ncbi:hypothetical protein ACT1UH_01230 [Mycoplasma sp. 332]|uniref:hypothetical protein n=1 Tax=Mycoplasma sp. 332 TaxID=3458236 RepID=UPI0040356A28
MKKSKLLFLGFLPVLATPVIALSCANPAKPEKPDKPEKPAEPMKPKNPETKTPQQKTPDKESDTDQSMQGDSENDKPIKPEIETPESIQFNKDKQAVMLFAEKISKVDISKDNFIDELKKEGAAAFKKLGKSDYYFKNVLTKAFSLLINLDDIIKINDKNPNVIIQLLGEIENIFTKSLFKGQIDPQLKKEFNKNVNLGVELNKLNVNSDKKSIEEFQKLLEDEKKLNELLKKFNITEFNYKEEVLNNSIDKVKILTQTSVPVVKIQLLGEISKLLTKTASDLLFPNGENLKFEEKTQQEKQIENVKTIVSMVKKLNIEANESSFSDLKKILEEYKENYKKDNDKLSKYGLGGNSYNEKSIAEAIKTIDELIKLSKMNNSKDGNDKKYPNLKIQLLDHLVRLLMPSSADFLQN